jgi:isopentenyl diphosphate isomerase/L-lactate dehydrogenase-like FMN-dependent dehydrogenase
LDWRFVERLRNYWNGKLILKGIMQAELKLVMGNCGTATVADINRSYVATPTWRT